MTHVRHIMLAFVTVLACAVLAAGCGKTELVSVSVSGDGESLRITTGFSAEIPYSIRTEQDGACIVLTAPGASLSEAIPRERLISDIDMISGWFARESGRDAEIRFYLTGEYPYTHSASSSGDTDSLPWTVAIDVGEKAQFPTAASDGMAGDGNAMSGGNQSAMAATAGETSRDGDGTPLSRGLALFGQKRFDDALVEFNEAVADGKRCPLAYFHAALIRLEKEQYSRALANLETALRDSAGFDEAVGYRAFTLRKLGRETEALAEWKRFVAAAGNTGGAPPAVAAIDRPDRYRETLEQEKERQRQEAVRREAAERAEAMRRQASAAASADSARLAEASAAPDTVASAEPSRADSRIVTVTVGDTGEDTETIARRVRNDIRRGIYGIIVTFVILVAGSSAVVVWLRRRSMRNTALSFGGEVDTFLRDSGVGEDEEEAEEQPALDEAASIRVFEEKRRIIQGAAEPERIRPEYRPAPRPEGERAIPASPEPVTEPSPPVGRELFLESSGNRQPITEEIKSLVTRMHREGRGIEEICRVSDLTKTEVELIIAVRARHMEQLIEEAADTVGSDYDTDQLYVAIRELRSDGDSPREIAKKLGVSTSEVQFALAVLERESGGRG